MEETVQPPVQSLEIREESVLVKRYTTTCSCGRVFRHRDRRTLQHNIDVHVARYHGVHNETRLLRELAFKKIRQIRNRMYGT